MRLYAEWLGSTVVEDHLDGVTHLSPDHWPWKMEKRDNRIENRETIEVGNKREGKKR